MSAVHDVKLQIGQISLVGMRALLGKDRVVLASHQKGRRLMFAKQRLPPGVFADIGAVVQKQLKLDFLIAGAIKQVLARLPEWRKFFSGMVRVFPLVRGSIQIECSMCWERRAFSAVSWAICARMASICGCISASVRRWGM